MVGPVLQKVNFDSQVRLYRTGSMLRKMPIFEKRKNVSFVVKRYSMVIKVSSTPLKI